MRTEHLNESVGDEGDTLLPHLPSYDLSPVALLQLHLLGPAIVYLRHQTLQYDVVKAGGGLLPVGVYRLLIPSCPTSPSPSPLISLHYPLSVRVMSMEMQPSAAPAIPSRNTYPTLDKADGSGHETLPSRPPPHAPAGGASGDDLYAEDRRRSPCKYYWYRFFNPWVRMLLIIITLYLYAMSSGVLTYRNNGQPHPRHQQRLPSSTSLLLTNPSTDLGRVASPYVLAVWWMSCDRLSGPDAAFDEHTGQSQRSNGHPPWRPLVHSP